MEELTLSGKIQNASDTNKLLWLILQELRRINQVGQAINQPEEERPATAQILAVKGNGDKPGQNLCKYCGEMIDGNKGKLLAHIRKCPSRQG